ncbi:efflux RND transporter periplasmic adaptor subunit [Brachybacterium saurashtrense]|uniref:Efflux RND transporter periplasmic adaptor subunit n=1 Tax=Brachybacterium saurashtrense TaxID=556288 RepID=A0A345YSE1_9MICO|nr:efflux RND transporter periplasmic adaptor subunit [Brachybacterium saurashtrense]AXK46843.1 efflux RND transporter periplasmic adaptor subunit [Brachybacterium saurashtrense]RRR22558.1 efflux RND transporter periplasmic adaptor subunit [Brachybacterium saurashtrense]
MDALRRYVFPVIWMLILGLIALALVKMAFFPSGADAAQEDPQSPTAEFDQYAVVPVETGDLSSELVLAAMVQPDAGTPLKATADGEINRIWLHNGDHVEKGQRILQVRQVVEPEVLEMPEEPIEGDETAAAAAPQAPAAEYRYLNLVATATGTLSGMEVAEWDGLATGDAVATISPGTNSIVADLTPEQQLSLLDVDLTATAALPASQDPVTCGAPAITEDAEVERPKAPQGEIDPFTGEPLSSGGAVSAAQLTCPVPAEERVVPGLGVEVTVDLGSRTGVLTVPTTAVEGEGASGTVYAIDEETGEPMPLSVTLGMRGEGTVEITGGLEEGQEILQFAPGVDGEHDLHGVDTW